jgi:hypothetical protein
MTEFVRVPFYLERDGKKTFFLPSCRMAGGYRIGAKGEEVTVADYWAALAQLTAMKPPRFRRPNGEGNFGIVKCETDAVEEVSREFIESELKKQHG